jgi:hypothetical protein
MTPISRATFVPAAATHDIRLAPRNPLVGKTFFGPGLASLNFVDATHYRLISEGGSSKGTYSLEGNQLALTGGGDTTRYTLSQDGRDLLWQGEVIFHRAD